MSRPSIASEIFTRRIVATSADVDLRAREVREDRVAEHRQEQLRRADLAHEALGLRLRDRELAAAQALGRELRPPLQDVDEDLLHLVARLDAHRHDDIEDLLHLGLDVGLGRDDEIDELAEDGARAAAAHLGLHRGDELLRLLELARALLGLVARGRERLEHAEELGADGARLLRELLAP